MAIEGLDITMVQPALSRICVFCGSSTGTRPDYAAAAHMLGQTLARQGITLVYGGARRGIMGVLANAALAAGGHVIGIIPRALATKEVAHRDLPDLRIVDSMHERKAQMAELADGFVALPGGFGTFEEFFEVVTWGQLGIHTKPCGLLNVGGYFDRLIEFVHHAVAEQFIKTDHASMVLVEAEPAALLARLRSYQPPRVHKWIGLDQI